MARPYMRCFLATAALLLHRAHAYIPALPTNSTQSAIEGGLNVSDVSQIQLQWFANGFYAENVSYQLVGNNSDGISRGALVHFSEDLALSQTTTTPWIALVACDSNVTGSSQEDDIFTLARDRGAVSALLYSLYSSACIINPEYASPDHFDQVFDIFSTQSLTSAHLIEYQFGQFGASNESIFGYYDARRLNDSAKDIEASIALGKPMAPGYLVATLRAYNATQPVNTTSDGSDGDGRTNAGPRPNNNTGLAMIILYSITGCVSALFILVIISGGIRALRHPERYGPRTAGLGGGAAGAQSRARGLTRAILDTFPVVKFGDTADTDAVGGGGSEGGASTDIPLGKGAEAMSASGTRDTDVEAVDSHDVVAASAVAGPSSAGSRHSRHSRHSQQPPRLPLSPPQPSTSSPSLPKGDLPASDVDDVERFVDPLGVGGSGFDSAAAGASGEEIGDEEVESLRPRLEPAAGSTSTHDASASASASTSAWRSAGEGTVVPDAIGRETCPICIVDFEEGDDLRVLPCEGKHRFHQSCVDPWLLELSSSCPICRQDFLALETILSGGTDDEVPTRASHYLGQNRFSRYLRYARRRNVREDPTDPYMPMAPDTSM